MASISIPGLSRLFVRVASGDALDPRQFSVDERISSLFTISLVVLSRNDSVDFDQVVGRPASFMLHDGQHERTWTGIVSHMQQVAVVEGADGHSTYHLEIVPLLWLATQRKNYRMFQQLSEPDIVKKVLSEWGIEPEENLTASYKKRKYRVQYGESDYAFVSRMLEDAGVSFYFKEEKGESKLVLSDAPQAGEERSPVAFRDSPTGVVPEHVTELRIGQRVRPGRYTIRDHDYRLPASYVLAKSATSASVEVEQRLERYQYTPGAFLFGADKDKDTPQADDKGKTRTDEKEGAAVVQKRLQAKRSTAKVCTFETSAHDLAPGKVIRVLDHPHADLAPANRWLIVGSTLSGTQDNRWLHQCEARSAAVPFRPPLHTPKPKISGVESATVVGYAGDEIHTDEFGRVRVHFHWDRESKMDDNSSCWIHVSQPWGGAGFGGTNLPRVGQEVLVDFLGGDPDRPVIVGRLYTNLQKTPYKLPDNKTQSGWQSRSSPGGGADNYNEIMFEDKKGQELVRMQAEKDLHKLVKHDEQVTIGNDRTKQVGHDDTLTVGNDRTRMVGNNEGITIGNSRSQSIAVNESMFVGANQTETIGMMKNEVVGLSSTETVGGAKALTVGAAYAITVGGAMNTAVGGISAEEVGKSKTVMVGDKIEIVCGASSIVLEKSGKVTIKGTEISVNGEQIVLTASGQAEMHGAKVKITGDPVDLN